MSVLKIIGYIALGLLVLVLIGGVGYKIVQKAEGYKADTQYFQTFEPHFLFGGCARYEAMKIPEKSKKVNFEELKPEVKAEVK